MIWLTAHFTCRLVFDLVICKLKEYDGVYDDKCFLQDQASLKFK